MSEVKVSRPAAWQPLTPGGVAAFAGASAGRLWVVQCLVGLLAAVAVVWFLKTAWYPPLDEAMRRLPAQGFIRSGRLFWPEASPVVLGGNGFLGLVVDLSHEGTARGPAQVMVEFGERDIRLYSLAGYVQMAYPPSDMISFNSADLLPWWGAHAPAFLALAALAVFWGLLSLWTLLAFLYCLPVWGLGFFSDRRLGLGASWRLAGAALMPGALLMTLAIVGYGLGTLDLVRLGIALAAHFIITWGYLVAAPLMLPRASETEQKPNPFLSAPPQPAPAAAAPAPAPPQNDSTGH